MPQYLVVFGKSKLIVNADKMFEADDELHFLNRTETNEELVALITKPKRYSVTETNL
jgi:hypothetical protein